MRGERRLLTAQIQDPSVRQNFEQLQAFFRNFALASSRFGFFEIELPKAETEFRIPHNLGFVPKDVIVTQVNPSQTVTWHYDQFDREDLVLSVSGACTIRAFIGAYQEGLNV